MEPSDVRIRLAAARRMIARAGCDSGVLGCISERADDGTFWASTYGAWDQAGPDDAVRVTSSLEVVEGAGRVSDAARLHAALYERRPDVGAIVHTHSHHATVVASSGVPIGSYNEVSTMYHDEQVCREDDGDRSPEAMAALADALGDRRVLLLKNHGIVAVAATLEEVAIDAIAIEKSARWHVEAVRFGGEEIVLPHVLVSKGLYDQHFRSNMWTANLRRLRRSDPDLFSG